jgi:hypothetical protein
MCPTGGLVSVQNTSLFDLRLTPPDPSSGKIGYGRVSECAIHS